MSRGKNIYQATPFGSCLLWGWVDYNSNLFCVVVLCAERRRQIESPSPSKRILQHSCMLYSLCSWVCAWFHALLLGILVLRKPLVHRVRKTYYETKECKNKSREDKRLRLSYSEVPKNCLKSIISICIQNGILAKCVSIRKPPFENQGHHYKTLIHTLTLTLILSNNAGLALKVTKTSQTKAFFSNFTNLVIEEC